MAINTALATSPPVQAGLRMLGNETAKALRVMWVHKAPLVFQLLGMTATFWVIQLFIGGGRYVGELLAMILSGYLAYVVSYIAVLRIAAGVLEEMFTGTLEQSLLSPLPPWVQSAGRLAATLVEAVLTAAVVAVFYLIVFAAIGVDMPWRWSAIVPAVITLADIAGFALLFGGLALIINSIGAIIHVVQGLIMFLNGALIPVFVFPGWLETAAKIAVPTTVGVDAARQILIDDASLGRVWGNGTLPWAVVHAATMLILGWTVYAAAIRRGLREGRLGA
ncbi:ABC-2 type transport system permease protein [Kribbella aluminosa]|uniref:ABC-2 type transport system permease protein n=1 Tax=Kribbella aluminosa TaxID=416017 RepID=A0ABS4UWK6_9ACTN|nr:ABC transporter permease [Kribbella aluminosa]MBP2356010.1 ABC-2 type transport system permease protein [Kribbella aluminosa]